jgi:hypothetical protein
MTSLTTKKSRSIETTTFVSTTRQIKIRLLCKDSFLRDVVWYGIVTCLKRVPLNP